MTKATTDDIEWLDFQLEAGAFEDHHLKMISSIRAKLLAAEEMAKALEPFLRIANDMQRSVECEDHTPEDWTDVGCEMSHEKDALPVKAGGARISSQFSLDGLSIKHWLSIIKALAAYRAAGGQ